MPWMWAPRKPGSRASSAAAMAAQHSPMWPASSVNVVGTQDVVPRRASSRLEALMPSASASIVAWPKKPWMCVSTMPGAIMLPV